MLDAQQPGANVWWSCNCVEPR